MLNVSGSEAPEYAIELDEGPTGQHLKELSQQFLNNSRQVYIPCTETVETVNGYRFKFTVETYPIQYQGKDFEVSKVIVEPCDETAKETNIYLGGYSINTPDMYRKFMPFAALGSRQVYLNLHGAGGSGFAEGNLTPFKIDERPALGRLNTYTDIAEIQILEIFREYAKKGHPVNLNGMSLGSRVINEILARNSIKPKKVTFDAPLTNQRFPFSLDMHLVRLVINAALNGYPQGLICLPGELSAQALRSMMLGKNAPNEIAEEIATACFKAVGSFAGLALSIKQDPFTTLTPERLAELKNIQFSYFVREDDITVPHSRLAAQIKAHQLLGLNTTVHTFKGDAQSGCHILAPFLSFQETLSYYNQ